MKTHDSIGLQVEIKSFEILVRQYHRPLLAYALALVPDSSAAEDLVQEAFVVAYRRLGDFDPARDFGAWMRGIIRHEAMAWRRERQRASLPPEVMSELEARHQLWTGRIQERGSDDALSALRECMARLGQNLRLVVDQFYFKDDSCDRIASQCGSTVPAVKKRLQRARETLARCVETKLSETGVKDG